MQEALFLLPFSMQWPSNLWALPGELAGEMKYVREKEEQTVKDQKEGLKVIKISKSLPGDTLKSHREAVSYKSIFG